MGYKVLSKQQWNSLPPYKKYQMRANTPDLYNYYQDRYAPEAEPVAPKEIDTDTEKRRSPIDQEQDSGGYDADAWSYWVSQLTPEQRALLEAAGLLGDFSPNAAVAQRVIRQDLIDLFDAGKGLTATTLQQVRSMNAGARGELREKLGWIKERVAEGYTREEARHLYYEWGGEGQELNPNKTLSDEIIAELYADYQAGNTPNAEAAGPTQSQITGKASSNKIYDKEGNLVRLTYDGEVYRQDDSGQWVTQAPQESTGDGGVTVLPGTLTTTEPDTSEETKVDPYIPYKLPENEEVDVTELTEEQQTDIWEDIKEGLGKIPGAIGKLIFGPKGMPGSVDEWIEWVDETLQAQMGPDNLPFPIVITTNPTEGTWIDLKIPINLDVNGTPIRIPLFDEDGNFVSSDELGKAWVDAKGQILGPLGEIGEIFLDDDGNIRLDLGQLEDILLEDLTLNPDGSITGSTAAEILIGKWFFNPDSGEWEEEEEVDINKDTVDDDTTVDDTIDDDTTTTDDDELGGLDEDPDEDPTPPAKAPRGKLITDKDGNPVRIIGTDGTNYVLDGDGQWVVAAVGDGDGGETVLPGTTTTPDEPVVIPPDEPVVVPPDEPVVVPPDEPVVPPDEPVVVPPDEPVVVPPDEPVVIPPDEPVVVPPDEPVVVPPDEPVVIPPDDTVVIPPDDTVVVPPDGPPDEPVVGGPVIVEGSPEEPEGGGDPEEPLVGATGPEGAAGAGGAAGRDAPRGGMMGGLSYNLPGFVGVQYQPKDYTVELDRIINESLFKGMI